MKARICLVMLLFVLSACDGSTGPNGGGKVAIKFGVGSSTGVSANLLVADPRLAADELTLTGTNGTLVIQDVRFIVEEMKLRSSDGVSGCNEADDENENENEVDDENEGDDNLVVSRDEGVNHDNDDGDDENDDDCEFEGGPFIVDLPLVGDATIATENVPAGTYDSFRFKIDDLEQGNDDEDDDRAATPALLTQMRTAYPDFPSRASLVVKGTQNGTPFTVFFRSKMKISQAINPPLVIPGDKALTVKIDPTAWFKNGTNVADLLSLNGKLVNFGAQFGRGISRVKRGDD
ncbi:MAG: hypothetical protein ABI681_07930 [Gemmatimonadales bacterium]